MLTTNKKSYLSHEFSEFFRRQKVSDVMAACCGLRQLKSLVGGLLHLGLAGFVFPGTTLVLTIMVKSNSSREQVIS
jgi:hypothetical protein